MALDAARVPPPNCSSLLLPQHLTPPTLVSAQVWFVPAAIAITPLVSPMTSVGTDLSVVVPSPSMPPLLSPQHLTPPPLVSAHVWAVPDVIETMSVAGFARAESGLGARTATAAITMRPRRPAKTPMRHQPPMRAVRRTELPSGRQASTGKCKAKEAGLGGHQSPLVYCEVRNCQARPAQPYATMPCRRRPNLARYQVRYL